MKRSMIVAMFLVLGVSMAALAGPGKRGGRGDGDGPEKGFRGPGGHGFGLCLALRDPALGVTEAQADQLKPLCRAQRDRMRSLGDSLGDLHDAVRAELDKDAPDFARVSALHQQIATLKTEMAKQHVELRGQARAILTAEQQATLKELLDSRGSGRDRGDGPRGGHGCDGNGSEGRPDLPPPDAER